MQAPNMPALPLRDIKLPSEPGFWPLAPGWWVMLALLLALAMWLGLKWYRHRQRKKRWLAINQQLSDIEFDYQKDHNSQKLLTELSMFLRRFVKHQLQQPQATSLAGDDWVAYLNQQHTGDGFAAFTEALSSGVYQTDYSYDETALLNTTRQFMQQQVMHPKKETPHV